MKTALLASLCVAAGLACAADPWRVAVLDFEDQTGMKADAALGGGVDPAALVRKGVASLGQQLANKPGYTLVDRRDFLAQITKSEAPGAPAPSFLRAAQALNADVVLRGALQAFSVGKTVVKQAGFNVEFSTLTLRVGLEALDPVDGAVIASASGSADTKVRQTENLQTVLGEAEVLALFEKALAAAVPSLDQALAKRAEAEKNRPVVKLNIKTSADPALVEIDGLLVGTTPLEGLQVYKGDHTITIGRAGHRDIRKRILLERDTQIEVPMIRTELSADELKDVLDKARVNMIIGEPGMTILPLQ